jgi:hypothetical protein
MNHSFQSRSIKLKVFFPSNTGLKHRVTAPGVLPECPAVTQRGRSQTRLNQNAEYGPNMPPKNRIGRVQRGVLRAFTVAPDREWSTRELMQWCHTMRLYRGERSRWGRHDYCKSIRRAADRLAIKVGRRWPDGIIWRRTDALVL